MARLNKGRYTAKIDGDFVVFLIGMRFNRPWMVHKWLPVFVAMPLMLERLKRHPELGLLHHRIMFEARGITVLQYWRSVEHLEHFARSSDEPHLKAWRRFNRKVGASKDVGVWHETFPVAAGSYDALYSNMPAHGLARAAGEAVPAREYADRPAA